MKEFNAQTGGRYTYVDDIINLQELSLAFSQIFTDCDNFVLSGCNIGDNKITPGFVYLNGKIRKFKGASNIKTWPQYLYENNYTESVAYASGADKVGRTVYSCEIASAIPSVIDPVTGKAPSAIVMQAFNVPSLKDALFGKYALLLNPAFGMQTVKGNVTLLGSLSAGEIISKKTVKIQDGSNLLSMGFDANDFIAQSEDANGTRYKFVIKNGVGITVLVNDIKHLTISSTGVEIHTDLVAKKGVLGGIAIQHNNIFNSSDASDEGVININMTGYNGGTTHYRHTVIGNGRGKTLLSVNGKNNSIEAEGTIIIKNTPAEGIVLRALQTKESLQLLKTIVWKDANDFEIGKLGYADVSNQNYVISNIIGNVEIHGKSFVNISAAIKENGQLLSAKYVLKTDYNAALNEKADKLKVYSITSADMTFANKKAGLAQFIIGSTNATSLRSQIGAIGADTLKLYAKNDMYLADMAVNEEAKRRIRTNIGAASPSEFQAKLRDTGWIYLGEKLYVRQIGNIVSIQGTLKTKHKGTVFTLPSVVDAPPYAVYQSVSFNNSRNWSVAIAANSKSCNVKYCNGSCGNETEFSLTYMV